MKKNKKRKTHKITQSKGFKLAIGITSAVVAMGAVCGLAVGLCVASDTGYVDITPYQTSSDKVSYKGTKDYTAWNASTNNEPTDSTPTMNTVGKCTTSAYSDNFTDRFWYAETIGNDPSISILDKSFMQSTYYAQTYWVHSNDTDLVRQTQQGQQKGTQWNYSSANFSYDLFPMNSLELSSDLKTLPSGKFSSAAQKPSGTTDTDFVNTYTAAFNLGRTVLNLPGFQNISPLGKIKTSYDKYDQKGFILIDAELPDANIASVQFRAEQAAFLSGISACQYLEENYNDVYRHVNNGQLAVGCFGGQNLPTVTCFMGGMELGVWFYNTYVLPNTDYYKNASSEERDKRTVKFISLGKLPSYFSGTFVIGDAKLIAQELLAKGASMLMAVAGAQTGDLVNEIVAQKSPCRVIGVDSAMEEGDWGQYYSKSDLFKEPTKVIFCSAEKNIAKLTGQILDNIWCSNRVVYPKADKSYERLESNKTIADIKSIASEESMKGSIGTIGYTSIGNVYNEGVKVSNAGEDYLVAALKLVDGPDDNWKNINSYAEAINAILHYRLPEKTLENGYKIESTTPAIQILNENLDFIY